MFSFGRSRNKLSNFLRCIKVFDRVWHGGLILKLKKGIRGDLLQWFETYLTNHPQVRINDSLSSPKHTNVGVPQGAPIADSLEGSAVFSPTILWLVILNLRARLGSRKTGLSPPHTHPVFEYCPFQGGTSVVVPYCYLFLLSVFILWFTYYVSDIF